MNYGVVLFYTTSAVMRAERILGAEKLRIKLIPTPRQFSSDCGIALQFDWDKNEQVIAVLGNAKVEIDAIHEMV
jgi:hypothetical protein